MMIHLAGLLFGQLFGSCAIFHTMVIFKEEMISSTCIVRNTNFPRVKITPDSN